jgi:hypothetical protein
MKSLLLLIAIPVVVSVTGLPAVEGEKPGEVKIIVGKYAGTADFSKPFDLLVYADSVEEIVLKRVGGEAPNGESKTFKSNSEIRMLVRSGGNAYRFSSQSRSVGAYTCGLDSEGKPWLVINGVLNKEAGSEPERLTARAFGSLANICSMAPLALLKAPADEPGAVESMTLPDSKTLKVRPLLLSKAEQLTEEALLAESDPTLVGARLVVSQYTLFAQFKDFQKQGDFLFPKSWTLSVRPSNKPYALVTIKKIEVLRDLPASIYSKGEALKDIEQLIKPKYASVKPK